MGLASTPRTDGCTSPRTRASSLWRTTAPPRGSDTADYMGFTIAGPKTFLGGGHPAEGSGDHANRGLIKSADAGCCFAKSEP